MGKAPAFQINLGDLAKVRPLSLAAKGAWIDYQYAMWCSQSRGTLTLTWVGYSRLLGATVEQTKAVTTELVQASIFVAETEGGPCNADVTQVGNAVVTLFDPKMIRKEKARQQTKLRVEKHRARKGCNAPSNANVTLPPSPPYPPPSLPPHTPPSYPSPDPPHPHNARACSGKEQEAIKQEFEAFWTALPRESRLNVSKKKALESYQRARSRVSAEKIMAGVLAMRRQWNERPAGAFVSRPPMATTWLNQERWDSDYSMPIPDGRGGTKTKAAGIFDVPFLFFGDEKP